VLEALKEWRWLLDMTHKNTVIIFAAIISILWRMGFPISKIGIGIVGAWVFRFYSALIALLVLLFVFFFIYKKQFIVSHFIRCIPLGILNMFLVPILNNIALQFTDSVKASVLVYTMPAITSCFVMISQRKIILNSLVVSVLCGLGILFFTSFDAMSYGEVIILLSAFAWALGTFLSGHVAVSVDVFSKVLYQNITSFLIILIFTMFLSVNLDLTSYGLSYHRLMTELLIPVIFIGVANGVLVYILWFYMIDNGGAELSSYSILISPMMSVLISYYYLGEAINVNMLIGMVLIFTSVALVFLKKKN
jgi:drug/metabolite transporter (DMT)-like permease